MVVPDQNLVSRFTGDHSTHATGADDYHFKDQDFLSRDPATLFDGYSKAFLALAQPRRKTGFSLANERRQQSPLLPNAFSMAISTSSSQSVPGSTDVTIERLDNPHQKVRVKRQLERLRNLSYLGVVCLLINIIYFAYRVKCSLDGLLYLSSLDVVVVWTFLTLE